MKTSLTRRHFLRTSAIALAAAAIAPPAFAKQRDLKRAIMWSTVGVKGSVMEKMQLAKAA